jgi:hypothetical protein
MSNFAGKESERHPTSLGFWANRPFKTTGTVNLTRPTQRALAHILGAQGCWLARP